MSVGENLRKLQEPLGRGFKAVRVLTVVGVADRTVVATDGAVEDEYACSSGYPSRAIGDKVLAVQLPGGSWYIDSALSTLATGEPVSEARVKALIAQASMPTDVSFGPSAPSGSGWVTGTVRVRVANGIQYVHVETSDPEPPPTPHVGPPPDDDDTTATAAGAWRVSSGQTDSVPKAGSWTGSDWYGAWFFTDRIEEISSAGTVASMTITVTRPSSDGGWDRGVPLRFGLHNEETEAKPTLTDIWSGPSISKGATAVVTIPSAQRALLVSGAKKGIGIEGSGRSYYVSLGSRAKVTVKFA